MTDFELKYSINPEMNFQKLKEQLTSLKSLLSGIKGDDIIDDKETISNIKNIEKEISKLDKEIDNAAKSSKKIDDGLKETSKTAGGLKDAFVGAFAGFSAANAVSAGLGMLKDAFTESLEKAKGFTSGLAELSAVTGVSGKGLDNFGESARQLALKFGTDVNEQISSFSGIISKFGPDLAKAPAALNSMTESVNTLAKAGLMTAAEAMEALTGTMLQFGIDAKDPIKAAQEMQRIMNVLSASATVGSASIQDVSASMGTVGGVAADAKLSIEETAAAIQTLALSNLKGSEAGIALRNILGSLQTNSEDAKKALAGIGIPFEELGKILTTKGVGAAMDRVAEGLKNIEDPAQKNAILMKVFGKENELAASALIKNSQTLKDYQKGLTGTNDAQRQADVIMASYAEKMKRLNAAYDDALLSVGMLIQEGIVWLIDAMGRLWETIKPVAEYIGNFFVEYFKDLWAVIVSVYEIIEDLWPVLKFAFVPVLAAMALMIAPVVTLLYGLKKIMEISVPVVKFLADTISKYLAPIIKSIGEFLDGTVVAFAKFIGLMDEDTKKTKKNTTAKKENTEEQKKKIEADKKAADAAKKLADEQKKKNEQDEKNKNNSKGAAKAAEDLSQKLSRLKKEYLATNDAAKKNNLFDEIAKIQKELDDADLAKKELELKINLALNPDQSLNDLLKETTEMLEGEEKKRADNTAKLEEENHKKALERRKKFAEKQIEDEKTALEARKDMMKAYADFYTGSLDILMSEEKTNLGQRLKAFGTFLSDTVEKTVIAAQAKVMIDALAASVIDWTAVLRAGAFILGMKALSSGAKALLGAETGVIGITQGYDQPRGWTDKLNVWLAQGESVITKSGTDATGNKDMLEFMNSGRSFMEFPGLKQMLNQNNVSTTTTVNDNSDILNKMNNNLLMVNESINQISGRVHVLDKDIYSANKRFDKKVKNRRVY